MDIFEIPINKTTGIHIANVENIVDTATWKLLYPANMNLVNSMKR